MDRLTRAKALIKRWAQTYGLAVAAALALFTGLPAAAQAQGKVSMNDIWFIPRATIGLVRTQTLRVTVHNNFVLQDGSVRAVRVGVKVYDSASNLLCQTDEVDLDPGEFHSFDIRPGDVPGRGDVNDLYIFRAPEGRIQVAFETAFKGGVRVAAGDVDRYPTVSSPSTFELIDNESGRTVLVGLLLPAIRKVRDKNGL
jgi:hypothetical protein